MSENDYTPIAISLPLRIILVPRSTYRKNPLEHFNTYNVYVVRDREKILYIGSTCTGVPDRIRGHIHDKKSPLGMWLKRFPVESRSLMVEIYKYHSQKEIREAERHFIHTLNPSLNITRYDK